MDPSLAQEAVCLISDVIHRVKDGYRERW